MAFNHCRVCYASSLHSLIDITFTSVFKVKGLRKIFYEKFKICVSKKMRFKKFYFISFNYSTTTLCSRKIKC